MAAWQKKITNISCTTKNISHQPIQHFTRISLAQSRAFVFPSRTLHPVHHPWDTWCHTWRQGAPGPARRAGWDTLVTAAGGDRPQAVPLHRFWLPAGAAQRGINPNIIAALQPTLGFYYPGQCSHTWQQPKEKILLFKCQRDVSWYSLPQDIMGCNVPIEDKYLCRNRSDKAWTYKRKAESAHKDDA